MTSPKAAPSIVINAEVRRFLWWMEERHRVHLKRTAGEPKPWTDDLVMRNNFFTNPFRENDKTTIWFRENIRNRLDQQILASRGQVITDGHLSPPKGPAGYPLPGHTLAARQVTLISNLLFATTAFRWFNYIPTGRLLCSEAEPDASNTDVLASRLDPATNMSRQNLFLNWDMSKAIHRLTEYQKANGKVFTGAYIIKSPDRRCPEFVAGTVGGPARAYHQRPLCFQPAGRGTKQTRSLPKILPNGSYDKIEAICWAINNVWLDRKRFAEWFLTPRPSFDQMENRLPASRTLQATHERLMLYPYLGDFMAYEIVTDLRHTSLLNQAEDIYSWANLGPGAVRGLRRILGLSPDGPQPKRAMYLVQDLMWVARNYFNDQGTTGYPIIEMRDIEHSLCEFDKYERARLGDGQMKRAFRGL